MTWKKAQRRTIRQWETIRDAIGSVDTVELLTGIHAICGLCGTSDQETGTHSELCDSCLFLQPFGGCREVGARLRALVVSRRLDEAWYLMDDIVRRTVTLVLPVESPARLAVSL